MTSPADLLEMLGPAGKSILAGLKQVGWGEEEIEAAQAAHPESSDLLYHSFSLICGTCELMNGELVYRAHARELLDRIIAGTDTRLATNAEVVCACSEASMRTPLPVGATTVYMRAFTAAFPTQAAEIFTDLPSYEVVGGQRADRIEAELRRKLRDPDRRLGPIICKGLHHGEQVACRFIPLQRDLFEESA